MDEHRLEVRAETRALKRHVAAALARRKRRHNARQSGAFLWLEPDCAALPGALLEDAVLEPVDKVIWLLLMMRARSGDGIAVLPTYAVLAKSANVAAKNTVIRAMSILRCRRRLTACHTSLQRRGRHISSAYALHAAALPLQDTVYLDPQYPLFLEHATRHGHPRVRKVAHDTLTELHQLGARQ